MVLFIDVLFHSYQLDSNLIIYNLLIKRDLKTRKFDLDRYLHPFDPIEFLDKLVLLILRYNYDRLLQFLSLKQCIEFGVRRFTSLIL